MFSSNTSQPMRVVQWQISSRVPQLKSRLDT